MFLSLSLLLGCVAPPLLAPPATDHPASAQAPAAPRAPASSVLESDAQDARVPLDTSVVPVGEAAEEAVYSCPMHPEVIRTEPGTCPKCGMQLMLNPKR